MSEAEHNPGQAGADSGSVDSTHVADQLPLNQSSNSSPAIDQSENGEMAVN